MQRQDSIVGTDYTSRSPQPWQHVAPTENKKKNKTGPDQGIEPGSLAPQGPLTCAYDHSATGTHII